MGFRAWGEKTMRFFVATDNTATNDGTELFDTGGTAATTGLLDDIDPGPDSSDPSSFDIFAPAGNVVFLANDGTHGTEYWLSNGTLAGTVRLDAAPAASRASYTNPSSFTIVPGVGYFVATDNTTTNDGTELYVTNGTAAGTKPLADINPGSGSSAPANFVVAGTNLVFTANDGTHGTEEWITNGAAAGTIRLDSDFRPPARRLTPTRRCLRQTRPGHTIYS